MFRRAVRAQLKELHGPGMRWGVEQRADRKSDLLPGAVFILAAPPEHTYTHLTYCAVGSLDA